MMINISTIDMRLWKDKDMYLDWFAKLEI